MSKQQATSNVRIQVNNPANLDVQVEVVIRAPGEKPVIEHYRTMPTPGGTSTPEGKAAESISQILLSPATNHHWITQLAGIFSRLGKASKLQEALGMSAILLFYLLMRFIGLTDYPTHFTADEAISTLQADLFIRNGFRNTSGEFLPTYFQNIDKYSLGTTVYLQVIPNLLIGWSIAISRGYAVFIGLIAAVSVALALKHVFKLRLWWASILLLSMLPAWFQLSRTTYETVTMVAFYAAGFYFYLLYRFKRPSYLYLSILFFALCFYSYAPAQITVALTGLFFGLSDFQYHWQERKTFARAALLIALSLAPYIRFQITHPGESWHYMTTLVSYVTFDISLAEKIDYFIKQYFFFLSPFYWFRVETGAGTSFNGPLYLMKGYGMLPILIALPLAWGLWLAIRNIRQPAHRAVLITFFVTPVSSALILSPSSLPRHLVFVIPVTLLTMLGLEDFRAFLQRKLPSLPASPLFSGFLLIVMVLSNLNLLGSALSGAASSFDDYRESGLQFGAKWVFNLVKEEAEKFPQAKFIVTPNWMMFPNLAQEFILRNHPVNLTYASVYDYDRQKNQITPETLFLITAKEYEFVAQNPKFTISEIINIIPYPSGEPGFYLVRMDYSENSAQIFAQEEAERIKPVTTDLTIDGLPARVAHSKVGDGDIRYVFDGNPDTLYKSLITNPVTFDITFEEPRQIAGIFIIHGSSPIRLNIKVFPEEGQPALVASVEFTENGIEGNTFQLQAPVLTRRVIISVGDLSQNSYGIVHIWDILFR